MSDKQEYRVMMHLNYEFVDAVLSKQIEAQWELASDTPCRTCGALTKRIAPNVDHSLEASCGEVCDPPIQVMDGMKKVVGE